MDRFYAELKDADWMCFDTEFVGEKRFRTLICLIQVTSPSGNYLLDPLRLPNLDPLLDLISDPKLLKITLDCVVRSRSWQRQTGLIDGMPREPKVNNHVER